MNWPVSAQVNRALLALAGIVLLGWLAWENLSDELLPTMAETGGYAQRLEGAASWQYDEGGLLAYHLVTPRAIQLDAERRYELAAPEAELVDEPGAPPWTLHAEHGTLLDDGETVRLDGSVRAARAPHRQRGRLELRTDRLWIYPQRQLARTDIPSILQELDDDGEARWTSEADTLRLDWGSQTLTQTDRIRDRIQPQAERR